jgi:hypothetical protein
VGFHGRNTSDDPAFDSPVDPFKEEKMKKLSLLIALSSTLLLTACLGDVMEIFCEGSPDSDHCYQTSAVQKGEAEDCSKIEYGPPNDKCHLMIAENTGDPSACEGMQEVMMGYTKEACLQAAFTNHSVEDCVNATDEAACRAAWGKNGKGCGDGYVWIPADGKCDVKKEEPEEKTETENPFENEKVKEDLQKMGDVGKSGYIQLLEWDIEHEKDPDRKAGLENYKEFLESAGEKIEDVQTKFETLQELKKIFIDSYDPKDAIENMSISPILGPGLVDRLKEKLTGPDEVTERSKAEDALTVYEKMLEQQKDNDFLQQGRLDRVKDTVIGKAKDKATETLKESVEDIAKTVAGDAFAVVGIVDHALSSFQEEAKKEMFVGLAAAYNRERDDVANKHPDWSKEQIHAETVRQVKENPYQNAVNSGFVKYGNILENGDCKNAGDNPLCIDNRVFWVAMDKTYEYEHRAKK